MKIRSKLSLLSAGLVSGVVLGSSAFFFIAQKGEILKKEQEKQIAAARGLSEVARESYVSSNDILALNYIKQLLAGQSEIAYAYVTDLKGKIVSHSNIARIGEADPSPGARKALEADTVLVQDLVQDGQAILDVAHPVRDGTTRVAVARVGLKRASLERDAAVALQPLKLRILLISVFSILLGVGLSLVFGYTLGSRIQSLAAGAAKIGAGQWDVKIAARWQDELGDLARQFNAMAAKLKELDEMKQDFVAGVTYELKPSLGVLTEQLKLSLEGQLGKLSREQTEALRLMDENTKRLSYFTNDLLALAKIEAGKMELRREQIDIPHMAKEVLEWFRIPAEEKHLEVHAEFPKGLPKAAGDLERTKQILANLVSNATKFTPKSGKVTVSALENTDHLELAVRDTGVGMPKELVTRIFDKFAQIKRTKDHPMNPKGTGLRLAIVKGIVEGQGGKIWAESEEGKGSVFHFTLPKWKR